MGTETDGRYHKGVTECIVATLREIEETSGMVWLEAFSADIGPSTARCTVCNREINSNKDHPLPGGLQRHYGAKFAEGTCHVQLIAAKAKGHS